MLQRTRAAMSSPQDGLLTLPEILNECLGEWERHWNVQERVWSLFPNGPTNVAAKQSDGMETGRKEPSAEIPSTPSESTDHNIKGLLYSSKFWTLSPNATANESDGREKGWRPMRHCDSARILCTSNHNMDCLPSRRMCGQMFRRLCRRWNGERAEDSETLRYNEERPNTTSQSPNVRDPRLWIALS